jgi:hypothetical protein
VKSEVFAVPSALRFERLLKCVDKGEFSGSAISIGLRLVTDVAVLHMSDLRAAASSDAQAYRDADDFFLEWPRGHDYIDRRLLSPRLVDAIEAHGGPALKSTEWSEIVRVLRGSYPDGTGQAVWQQFLADACAWWGDHLPPVLINHATRSEMFQPLDRQALARRARLRREP